jgi:hypothetical protein
MADDSDADSDQENVNPNNSLQGWETYDPANNNHYPIYYTDEFGREQLCCYIRYVLENGIPTIQGCRAANSPIYGDTLHPRPHPNPVRPQQNPEINDMRFGMFDSCIKQRLLVDNAVAALDDISITAEVARYRAAMLEFRDARRLVAEGGKKLLRAEEKKTAAEGYLFRARVFTRICHLIFDPSLPPSPEPAANTAYPSIVASEGPSDGWGHPTWTDPPSQPLRNPLTRLGPCETCGDVYHVQASCPFEFCCHNCWGTDHLTSHCPICPADEEMYEEEYGLVPSDPEAE